MLRRPTKSATALDQSKEELARRESELREKMEKLERMIAEAPRVAEETSRRQREELLMRANEGGSRLDVSIALQDKRYGDASGRASPARFAAQGTAGRPDHFSRSGDRAGRGRDLAGQPFAVSSNGRERFRSRCCLRRQTGAAQSERRRKGNFFKSSSATF